MSNALIITTGIGIIQSILFGLLLLQKKEKDLSDWILLGWFVVFGTHLLLIQLISLRPHPASLIFAKTFALLHGPLLLLYTISVFEQKWHAKSLIHLLPFVGISIVKFLLSPDITGANEVLLLISKSCSLIGYPLYVWHWLSGTLSTLKSSRADSYILESRWIRRLIFLLLAYAGIGILHVGMDLLLNIRFSILLDIILYVSMINIIGFYGLKFKLMHDDEAAIQTSVLPKYQHSPLRGEAAVEKKAIIEAFFSETEAYLNSEFSLSHLSNHVGIPRHHLSEIINQQMGTTFYDLVNSRRIEQAKKRLLDGSSDHLTLEGLGYECGFNTKSAFYHQFKRYTGKTPGKFRSEIRPD